MSKNIFMHLTQTEENYLKAIFTLSEKGNGSVNTNAIAKSLETSASSVTDMYKKLLEKDLIIYQKYKPIRLSKIGKKIATNLIRKHRLWECFLVEKLNFNWSEVHDIAEQLEHIKSELLIEKLADFLGNPLFDPHGDPIPDKNGTFPSRKEQALSSFKKGEFGLLSSVDEDDNSFLEILNTLEIKIGTKIKVEEIVQFDQSIHVLLNDSTTNLLSNAIASNLYVIKN